MSHNTVSASLLPDGGTQQDDSMHHDVGSEEILIGGGLGSKHIRRVEGGPITVIKSNGREEATLLPENDLPGTESLDNNSPETESPNESENFQTTS